MKTVIVTWMDGKQETYTCNDIQISNGIMHLFEYTGVTYSLKNEWHLPLDNIRIYKVER